MNTVLGKVCVACGSVMSRTGKPWLFRCSTCGYYSSSLSPRIRDSEPSAAIDEGRREQALGRLRNSNFERVLDRLGQARQGRLGTLLDVGCAHGWFIQAARRRGYAACGIDPDPAMHAMASAAGLEVWLGFFPGDIPDGLTFDVISFNDAFEHLPDPGNAISVCRERLSEGGHLVINIPSSRGFFYQTAALLDRIGVPGPFDRMWQRQFASPHLSYFNCDNLRELADRNGLREVHRSTLPSLSLPHLWPRLRYDRGSSVIASGAIFLAVACVTPLLRLFPADISLQVFCRVSDAEGTTNPQHAPSISRDELSSDLSETTLRGGYVDCSSHRRSSRIGTSYTQSRKS